MFRCLLACAVVAVMLFSGQNAQALPGSTELPTVDMPKSPLIITAYALDADRDASDVLLGDSPRYIEVYNSAKTPILLDGWNIQIDYGKKEIDGTVSSQHPEILPLQPTGQYIPPGQYVTVDFTGSISGAAIAAGAIIAQNGELVTALSLTHDGYEAATVAMDMKQFSAKVLELQPMRRKSLTATTFAVDDPAKVYDQGLYTPKPTPGLQITEVLPNPQACSPADDSLDCTEYIELYNPYDVPVSLDGYRLRTGSKTSTASSANTAVFSIQDVIAANSYVVVPLELTNSGSYVWLEDMFGAVRYDETIIEYPDMSSTTHKGQSWAVDANSIWGYATPSPLSENILLPPKPATVTKTSSPKPCNTDQERNPVTGRCRKVTVMNTQKLCAVDEYRNPDTNRCRKITSSTNTLTACKPGQERNPETNRCRAVVSTASNLKPCAEGQIRNPATNRCKKATGTAQEGSGFKIVPPKQNAENSTAWWVGGAAGLLALSYAGWEWRHELAVLLGKMRPSAGAGER